MRRTSANEFMYGNGPVNRFVAEAGVPTVYSESVWPGGTSALPGNPFYLNQLPRHLTNDTVPLLFGQNDLQRSLSGVSRFVPAQYTECMRPQRLRPRAHRPLVCGATADRRPHRGRAWPAQCTSGVTPQLLRELRQRADAAGFGALAPVLQLLDELLARGGGAAPYSRELAPHVDHRLQRA